VRLLFASLLGLLAAIGAGILFNRDTGRVLLSLGEWTVQTTLSFFVVAVVILFIVLYVLIRSLMQLVRLPRDWSRWSVQRRRLRSERYLLQGLAAMLQGDWRGAERAFQKGAPFSGMPEVNLLGAARSAQQQGAVKRCDRYLKLAHAENGSAATEVALIRASLELDGPDSGHAYATLKGIEAQHPRDERVRLALFDAALRREDWAEAERLLGGIENAKLLPEDELLRAQLAVHAGLLRGIADNREQLEQHWRRLPAKLQREPRLLEAYVRARLRHPDAADCEPLLRRTLERRWHPELVDLYGQIEGADPARQLRVAESWLENRGADAVLRLALGRQCLRAGLWGKAREYLDESIRLEPSAEAYLALGALHEQQGDLAAAADCYRRGLGAGAG
jgi:HemY protein